MSENGSARARLIFSLATAPLPTARLVEDAYIEFVLTCCNGNKARAAQVLGISRETLRIRRRDLAGADRPHRSDIEIVFRDAAAPTPEEPLSARNGSAT